MAKYRKRKATTKKRKKRKGTRKRKMPITQDAMKKRMAKIRSYRRKKSCY